MASSEDLSMDAVPVSNTDSGFIPEQPSDTSSKLEVAEYVNKMVGKTFEPFKEDITESNEDLQKKIRHYLNFMDYELSFGYQDAMILYHDKDKEDVIRLCASVEKNVVLHDKQKPRIALYPSIAYGFRFEALSFGLERCTFVMLYITSNFVNDAWSEVSSETCLMEAIYNPDKRWCVVPVFADDKSYKVPISINILKGVQYSIEDEASFLVSIQTLFNDRISVRNQHEKQHLQKQMKWVLEFEAKAREEAFEKLKMKNDAKRRHKAFLKSVEQHENPSNSSNDFTEQLMIESCPSQKSLVTASGPPLGSDVAGFPQRSSSNQTSCPITTSEGIASKNKSPDSLPQSALHPSASSESLSSGRRTKTNSQSKSVAMEKAYVNNVGISIEQSLSDSRAEVHYHNYYYEPLTYNITNANAVQIGDNNTVKSHDNDCVENETFTKEIDYSSNSDKSEEMTVEPNNFSNSNVSTPSQDGALSTGSQNTDNRENTVLQDYGINHHKPESTMRNTDPDQTRPKEIENATSDDSNNEDIDQTAAAPSPSQMRQVTASGPPLGSNVAGFPQRSSSNQTSCPVATSEGIASKNKSLADTETVLLHTAESTMSNTYISTPSQEGAQSRPTGSAKAYKKKKPLFHRFLNKFKCGRGDR